jgi:hypothetical protein
VSTNGILDFTVTDLLQGGDDVLRLVAAAGEPDGVWDEVGRWPRHRLTAALVAALGIIEAEDYGETGVHIGGRLPIERAIDRALPVAHA